MTSSNKSTSQENQKKPTFVALIKKNKPDPPPESSSKPEEIIPKKTSSQSRGKKSTNSTTKSKSTTTSTSSKAPEKTTPQTNPKTTQSKTNIKAKRQSPSTSEPKIHSKSQSKTPSKTQSQLTSTTEKQGQGQRKPAHSKTQLKTQNQSPTSQPKNTPTDPIAQALLYKNEKKQRLDISDYKDLLSARDISLSITGLSSIAAGSALQALLAGSLMGIFSFPALLLLSTVLGKYALQFHRTALDVLREEEAERKIAQLLKDTYLDKGGEIYSILDDNPLMIPNPDEYEPDYLDIGLGLPSGQWLAISVKALKGKKDAVYIDQNTKTLRYRRARGIKQWGVHPLDELKRQIAWFQENTQIFPEPPLGIIVFMKPTKLKLFEGTALTVGETKILCLDNIYIVQEKDLLDFIDAVQSRGKV
ncbi:hypothetical protein PCC8801_4532 (plasmid) [Rippkaea orientalis PCC 8801]|uniref:Uncharacterized protein n=1 Tax=Rippkaea orientalis (strain PCC 8801 / RF-1) TaxID=41431 RepID=B7K6L9_RIPO1|nr:hypothetical protein [Rippkaea orientalis]ACK68441.1 hypothetical protein PCC8801_4532 [Rippkaea orientalis PCC 8801]